MIQSELIGLIDYSRWANGLFTVQMEDEKIEDEKCLYWLNHIANALKIWLDRIEGDIFTNAIHHAAARGRPSENIASVA